MTFFVRALAVFALGIVAAAIRVYFTRRATQGRAIWAANFHTLISASAAYGTILYVQNASLVPALLVGCWLGTFWATKHDAK